MAPIRMAVVDDSTFIRKALVRIFEKEPAIRVMGAAASGEELLANLGKWRPEVITLDLSMPGMGGLATLDRIMAWRNIPVIILSTHSAKDAPLTIEALHRGAVDFIDKQQHSLVDFDGLRKVLTEKILHVTGNAPAAEPQDEPIPPRVVSAPAAVNSAGLGPFDVVVLGASTGGPPAIQQILDRLTGPPPVPIVIVQHMPDGFTEAFANRLHTRLPFPVLQPSHGEKLRDGAVYIARTGVHLHLAFEGGRLVAKTTRFPEEISHRPSIDILFQSTAALTSQGVRPLGVLLTGMGKDGAAGMASLASNGAYTLAQNEATCIVYGMPKAARDLGAVAEELPLPAIAPRVIQLLAGRQRGAKVHNM